MGELLLRLMAPAGVSASCQGALTGSAGIYKLASCSLQAAKPTDAGEPSLEPHCPYPQALQIHLHRSEAGTIASLINSPSHAGYLYWLLQAVKSRTTGEGTKQKYLTFWFSAADTSPAAITVCGWVWRPETHKALSHKSSTPQLMPRKQLCLYHVWLSQNCHHQHGSKAEGSTSALDNQLPQESPKSAREEERRWQEKKLCSESAQTICDPR